MTKEEIKGIELIKKFMNDDSYGYSINWTMLMLVINKIEKLGFDVFIGGYNRKIHSFLVQTYLSNDIVYRKDGNKMRCVFKGIVDFIKWHNTPDATVRANQTTHK